MPRFSGRTLQGVLLGHVLATDALAAQPNWPDATIQQESDDFVLEPGRWQWTGTAWVPFTPPPPPPSALAVALDTLLAIPSPTPIQIVSALRVWRQQIR